MTDPLAPDGAPGHVLRMDSSDAVPESPRYVIARALWKIRGRAPEWNAATTDEHAEWIADAVWVEERLRSTGWELRRLPPTSQAP